MNFVSDGLGPVLVVPSRLRHLGIGVIIRVSLLILLTFDVFNFEVVQYSLPSCTVFAAPSLLPNIILISLMIPIFSSGFDRGLDALSR